MPRAVVDIGSNSVLLLVAERTPGGWTPIFESSRVTGLGQGTKESGLLGEPSIERTLQALKVAFGTAQSLGCTTVLAAATMAARIAANTPEFQKRAASQGTHLQVLPAKSEAQLGFLAVSSDPLFTTDLRLSIIDPGGNSTELVTADKVEGSWNTVFERSFPVGTLGLRDTLMPDEAPPFSERMAALSFIDQTLEADQPPTESGRVVVLGATGTNLVTIRERITAWDPAKVHGATLTFEEVARAVGWLCDMTDWERSQIVGIEPGRETTIHIGTLILERCMHALRSEQCTVSVRGWRHALLESDRPNTWFS